jgi:hypothetical protein
VNLFVVSHRMSLKYHLVRFDDASLNVVSERWMLSNSSCSYPDLSSDAAFIKCCKKHDIPLDHWGVHNVKILYTHGEFISMLLLCNKVSY